MSSTPSTPISAFYSTLVVNGVTFVVFMGLFLALRGRHPTFFSPLTCVATARADPAVPLPPAAAAPPAPLNTDAYAHS